VKRSWKWPAQVIAYLAFMVFIGYFSNMPSYRHLAPDMATIKLSLRHAGQIMGVCHQRTPEEMANLPANMRVQEVCPRERSPLILELELDGELALSRLLPARGVHSDGRASTYQRLSVPAGNQNITVRLKDHIDAEDFHYTATRTLYLPAGANLVIDFDEQARDFEFLLEISDQGTALQNTLKDLEADHREYQNDGEEDDAAIGQRLTATLLDDPQDPVGEEIEPHGNQGE